MAKKRPEHICKECSKKLDHFDTLFYHWQSVMMALSTLASEESITDRTAQELSDHMMYLKGLVMEHDDACHENDPD